VNRKNAGKDVQSRPIAGLIGSNSTTGAPANESRQLPAYKDISCEQLYTKRVGLGHVRYF